MKSIYLVLVFCASLIAIPYVPSEMPDCCPKQEATASKFVLTVKQLQSERQEIAMTRKKKEREILTFLNIQSKKAIKRDSAAKPF